MAVAKKYGTIKFNHTDNKWILDNIEPHVCIRLKNIFKSIPATGVCPFKIKDNNQVCADIEWFMERYPLEISDSDKLLIESGVKRYHSLLQQSEAIFLPGYIPPVITLKKEARLYQVQAVEFHRVNKRYLLGDDLGLGKTISAIATLVNPEHLPVAIVMQAHLPIHWQEKVKEFTDLRVHKIKKSSAYSLPESDVYIFKYTSMHGWVDIFKSGFFKTAIYDEVQELRISGSRKYSSAMRLSENVEAVMALSATPIYNYGDEMFNVMNLIKPGCLGTYDEFLTEWAIPLGSDKWKVRDPKALGTYLRDSNLFLRRTRKDVGRELPPVNKIVHYVEHDEDIADEQYDLARALAIKVTSGTFMERGQASREFDITMRLITGVSKAKSVAAFVRVILESGEKVVLVGWHRDVYEIWLTELADFNPVMYTGSESATQKDKSKQAFIKGESNLFILSLRSGTGLDGLQDVCSLVVFGEMDYSPKVHDQDIARVDRDGQQVQVTAIFLVSNYGSDPVIIDILGLKSSQSQGIVDPNAEVMEVHSDENRIKKMAEAFLKKDITARSVHKANQI
jgi:hypothetical protein